MSSQSDQPESTVRRQLLLLGIACLVLRALTPAGYMPSNFLAGEFMVLCPVGIPAEVVSAMHTGHGDHSQDIVDAGRALHRTIHSVSGPIQSRRCEAHAPPPA